MNRLSQRRRTSTALRVLKTSPFTYRQHFSCKHYLQFIFGTIFLCPIRLVFLTIFLALTIFTASIVTCTTPVKKRSEPITGRFRKFIIRIAAILGRLVFFSAGFGPVSFIGTPAKREEAPIFVVAPHSTFFDAFIPLVINLVSVVGKSKAATGIFGPLALMCQPVLVDRDDKNSRRKALKDISDRCNLEKPWPQLLIFPEGTCSNRTALFKFKIGAFLPGKPVQPVCVHWPRNLDTTTWTWDGPGIFKLMWMTLCQWNTKLVLEFLPVYEPNEAEIRDAELYANNVRDKMAEALQIPTTEFSYQACKLINLATKCDLPMSLSIVDLFHLKKLLAQVYPETRTRLPNGPTTLQNHLNESSRQNSGESSEQKAMRIARFTHFARNNPQIEWFQEIPEFAAIVDSNGRLFEGIAQCYLVAGSNTKIDVRKLAAHMNILFRHGDIRTRFLKATEVYKNISEDFASAQPEDGPFNCEPITGYAIDRTDAKHFLEAISSKKFYQDQRKVLDIVQTCIQRGNGHIFSSDLYEVLKEKQPCLISCYTSYLKESHTHYQMDQETSRSADKKMIYVSSESSLYKMDTEEDQKDPTLICVTPEAQLYNRHNNNSSRAT